MPTPIVPSTEPNNHEAEESLVGSLLIDPSSRYLVEQVVDPTDFYDERLGSIAKVAFRMDGDLDYTTLTDKLDRPDWNAYIASLIASTPTSVHAEHYARIVRRDSIRRQTIRAAGEIAGKAYHSQDPDEILAFANKTIGALDTGSESVRSVEDVVSVLYDSIQEWGKHPISENQVRGFDMGFASLNRLTDGISPGELCGIAGRPSTGKSSIAFEIARRAALRGDKVLIFSLEMTAAAVIGRWASAMSHVESRLVKRGIGDVAAYSHAVVKLSQLKTVWIDDTPGLTPQQIRARTLQKHREVGGLDVFIVDHGRKMRLNGDAGENTATVEGRKTALIKDLCKEVPCAGILVLQLNRGVELRTDKRPVLSDLRSSGEHEEELDICLGIYRQNYIEGRSHEEGAMEVQCLKHREGRAGPTAELWFRPQYQEFSEAQTRPLEEVEL